MISQRITNLSVSQAVAVSGHQSAVHGRFQNLSQYTSGHTHTCPEGRLQNRIVIDFLADIYTLLLLVCLISADLIKHLENPATVLIHWQGGWFLLAKGRQVWI